MAEFVPSAVLSVLFEKLMSPELLDFATQEGVRSKFEKWEKTLRMIKALLIDAEEKQHMDGAVKMWLEELQDLAYDAEDILDECATEALRRKLRIEENQATVSRARKLIPACCIGIGNPHALWSNLSMPSKIDGITRRLLVLCEQRAELGLVEIPVRRLTDLQRRPAPTTSLPTGVVVYGRDEDKAKILEMVLSDEPAMPALVWYPLSAWEESVKQRSQLVYKDAAVADFNPKVWVSVPFDFDVLKISTAILDSIIGSTSDMNNLPVVQNQLTEKLAGKKFLLVLDDVWNEDYSEWEILRSPFVVGAPGSKIIVTTRSLSVASVMGPFSWCYKLHLLSDDDCWSLFQNHATDSEVISSDSVELIREKVVEKCKGLPLIAVTLGGLLRFKKRDEWSDILIAKHGNSLKEMGSLQSCN